MNQRKEAVDQISLAGELDQQLSKFSDHQHRITQIRSSLSDVSSISSKEKQLDKLDELLELLNLHSTMGSLSEKEVQTCIDLTNTLLELLGGYSKKNTLSTKYGQLYRTQSKIERNKQRHWSSYWTSLLSNYCDNRKIEIEDVIAQGVHSLRLFHGSHAVSFFNQAKKMKPDFDLEQYRITQILYAYLLSGNCHSAKNLLRSSEMSLGPDESWIKGSLVAIEVGDLTNLHKLVKRGGMHYSGEKLLLFYGWSLAVRSRQWLKQITPVQSLRRRKNLDLDSQNPFYRAIQVVQECYDYERPFYRRLEKLGKVLEQSHGLESAEQELLLWSAATRWLWRSRARDFARVTIDEYKKRCLSLSEGHSQDVLNIMKDIKIDGV